MGKLMKSRKFWIAMVDLVVSVVTYLAAKYLAPTAAEDVLTLLGIMQAPVVLVIVSMTVEDVQAMRMGIHPIQLKMTAEDAAARAGFK